MGEADQNRGWGTRGIIRYVSGHLFAVLNLIMVVLLIYGPSHLGKLQAMSYAEGMSVLLTVWALIVLILGPLIILIRRFVPPEEIDTVTSVRPFQSAQSKTETPSV